ncbi:MAG: ATP-binding protein, partial [Candidatus Eisenbacteria sp.]|nr:ATP-binding protein [Candidatus Eisenbacteria bacterium]
MDTRFEPHNTHLEDRDRFALLDPQLRDLSRQPLVHRSDLLDALPMGKPGIYSITGGRQIGKTTLLKQWMAELLHSEVEPRRIAFFTGELIDDHHSLVRLVAEHLGTMPVGDTRYILLDEITYTRDWDKGIKYLADAGLVDDTVLLLTGSDSSIIQEARTRFPGRRGMQDTVDFHVFPLCFAEVVRLKGGILCDAMDQLIDRRGGAPAPLVERLFEECDEYL